MELGCQVGLSYFGPVYLLQVSKNFALVIHFPFFTSIPVRIEAQNLGKDQTLAAMAALKAFRIFLKNYGD